jgi:signal peptidase I
MGHEDLEFFETAGLSMWPFLGPGERLIIKRVTAGDLRIGDLVIYREGDMTVCHRLVKKTKSNREYLLYARGDSATRAPDPVRPEILIGRVVGRIKNGRVINVMAPGRRFAARLIVIVAPWLIHAVRAVKKVPGVRWRGRRDG